MHWQLTEYLLEIYLRPTDGMLIVQGGLHDDIFDLYPVTEEMELPAGVDIAVCRHNLAITHKYSAILVKLC